MKLSISAAIIVALAIAALCVVNATSSGSNTSSNTNNNNNKLQNSLTGQHNNGNANIIEHSTGKSRMEVEKRQISLNDLVNTKTILKSISKLLFGTQDEINATSRHVLGILSKVLDFVKSTFNQKGRSGSARTIRDSAEGAAIAGVSVLQGYIKSVLANDARCVQRYLCQASKEAIRDGREVGYVISSLGGYVSSYLLDESKSANFNSLHEASMKGRSVAEDCAKIYPDCNEQ